MRRQASRTYRGGGWYCNMEGNRLLGNPQLRKSKNTELPAVADFDIQKWMGLITGKAVGKIEEFGKTGKPFFLYLALNSPHKPIVPDTEFIGASGIEKYGDYCQQVDWGLGQIMTAIAFLTWSAGPGTSAPTQHAMFPYR